MGEASPSEQERDDQLQVVLSEFVSFPDQTKTDRSFEQVMDQAFDQAVDQASTRHNGSRRIWPSRSSEEGGSMLGGVPGLRMMGF